MEIIESGFNLQILRDSISVSISAGNVRYSFYVEYNSIERKKGKNKEYFIFRYDGIVFSVISIHDEIIKFSNKNFFSNVCFEIADKEKRDLIYRTIKEIINEIKQKELNKIDR